MGWYCNITDTTIVQRTLWTREGRGTGGYTQLLTAHHSANYLVFAIVTNLYYAGILIKLQILIQCICQRNRKKNLPTLCSMPSSASPFASPPPTHAPNISSYSYTSHFTFIWNHCTCIHFVDLDWILLKTAGFVVLWSVVKAVVRWLGS